MNRRRLVLITPALLLPAVGCGDDRPSRVVFEEGPTLTTRTRVGGTGYLRFTLQNTDTTPSMRVMVSASEFKDVFVITGSMPQWSPGTLRSEFVFPALAPSQIQDYIIEMSPKKAGNFQIMVLFRDGADWRDSRRIGAASWDLVVAP